MRQLAFYLIVCTLLITGCTSVKQPDYSNTYNIATDTPYHLIQQGRNQNIIELDNGYYFLNSNYIYYADKETMQPVLLDSNPNSDCLADTSMPENCGAFVYYAGLDALHFLTYYDGHLYAVQQAIDLKSNLFDIKTYQLIKISLDGSTRSIVLEFDETPYFLAVHRGTLYVTTARITNPETENYRLLAYNMDNLNNDPEVIFSGNQPQGMVADIFPYGKNIYFRESLNPFSNYYRYDLETKAIQKMFIEESGTETGYINGIKNDTIIYSLFRGDLMDEYGWQARTVTLENEQQQQLELDPPFLSYYYWHDDDPNLYMYPVLGYEDMLDIKVANELTVFDEQFNKIATIPTPVFNVKTNLFIGNKDYMFAYTREADEFKWYILNKHEIASGNASFKEWVSTPSISFSHYSKHF